MILRYCYEQKPPRMCRSKARCSDSGPFKVPVTVNNIQRKSRSLLLQKRIGWSLVFSSDCIDETYLGLSHIIKSDDLQPQQYFIHTSHRARGNIEFK